MAFVSIKQETYCCLQIRINLPSPERKMSLVNWYTGIFRKVSVLAARFKGEVISEFVFLLGFRKSLEFHKLYKSCFRNPVG